jgi:hypothetical protein
MKATCSIATLRKNGFSIFNCTGNTCRVQTPVPFFVKMTSGELKPARQVRSDAYEFVFRGQFATKLPKEISL